MKEQCDEKDWKTPVWVVSKKKRGKTEDYFVLVKQKEGSH